MNNVHLPYEIHPMQLKVRFIYFLILLLIEQILFFILEFGN